MTDREQQRRKTHKDRKAAVKAKRLAQEGTPWHLRKKAPHRSVGSDGLNMAALAAIMGRLP